MARGSFVELSIEDARRLAVSASGFGRTTRSADSAAPAPPTRTDVFGVVKHLGQLQIDSVSVFERAHYMPVFSRLGDYDRGLLDRLGAERGGLIEYWPHQAGFIPAADWGMWTFRRDEWIRERGDYLAANRDLVEWVTAELRANGPMTASEFEHDLNQRKSGWWEWSAIKRLVEVMWRTGDIVCQTRRGGFEKLYELPEMVRGVDTSVRMEFEEASAALVDRAARALGVATEADIADYWRMRRVEVRPAIQAAEESGVLKPARVEGWTKANGEPVPAWVHRSARATDFGGAALLSPFDPLVWFRDRNERLFDFHYRIEIYTPEPQRVFGYYTLPLLVGQNVVGRIDLKRDRPNKTLQVRSAWVEEPLAGKIPDTVIDSAREELSRAARWQSLERVEVFPRGNLAPSLASSWSVS